MSGFQLLRSGSVKKSGDGALFASARAISSGCLDEMKLERGGLPIKSGADAEVRPNDVLVVLRGPVNAAAAIPRALSMPLFATLELAIVRPHAALDAKYLAWLINQSSSQAALAEMRLGGGVQRLPLAALEKLLLLPTPSLETQRTIAAIDDLAREEARLSDQLAALRTTRLRAALLAAAHTPQIERHAHARS